MKNPSSGEVGSHEAKNNAWIGTRWCIHPAEINSKSNHKYKINERKRIMDFKKKLKAFFTLERRANEGFTLVELIVVIAVLAILGGVAVPAYSSVMASSNKKICNIQMRELQSEAKEWCINNNWNTYVSYAIGADENGNRIFLDYNTNGYVSGLNPDQLNLFNSEVHPNVKPCPAGGIYYVKVISSSTGIPKIECVCSCEAHKDNNITIEGPATPPTVPAQ